MQFKKSRIYPIGNETPSDNFKKGTGMNLYFL